MAESIEEVWNNRSDEQIERPLSEIDEYEPEARAIILEEARIREGISQDKVEKFATARVHEERSAGWHRWLLGPIVLVSATAIVAIPASYGKQDYGAVATYIAIPSILVALYFYGRARHAQYCQTIENERRALALPESFWSASDKGQSE